MAQTNYDKMVADLDDGYAKVSNLLLEAFAFSPVGGPEFRVICFIIRRTYGYAKRNNDAQHKTDQMYYADIARGTDMSQRTVEGALRNLKRVNMLVIEKTSNHNKTEYGINTRVHEWGDGSDPWKEFHIKLADAQAYNIFKAGQCCQNTGNMAVNSSSSLVRTVSDAIRESTDSYPPDSGEAYPPIHGELSANQRIDIRQSADNYPPISGEGGALKPTATGEKGASTNSITNSSTNSSTERDASPVGEAHQTALEMGLEHTPETAPVIRAQSPQQRVGDATLNMFRLTHDSLSKEQCAKYYKAIASVIKSTYLGAEGILEWIAKQPQQTLGEGSDPAISIPAYLRSNFQTYQKHLEFAKERQQRMGESGNCASYGDAGAGGNGNGSKKNPSRQDDILTYWKIRALEDVNDKLPTPDMDTRSRLAGERQRIVVRIGYEPDFDTKPQSA